MGEKGTGGDNKLKVRKKKEDNARKRNVRDKKNCMESQVKRAGTPGQRKKEFTNEKGG